MSDARNVTLEVADLDRLLGLLAEQGFRCIGPTVRDGAIVYDTVTGTGDLPRGWTDSQEAGRYRLVRRQDEALFGYAVGPHAWKRYLFPPRERLWRLARTDSGFVPVDDEPESSRLAFIGVRA